MTQRDEQIKEQAEDIMPTFTFWGDGIVLVTRPEWYKSRERICALLKDQPTSLNFIYNRQEVKEIIERNLQFGVKNTSEEIAEEVFCYLAILKIKHEAKVKDQPCKRCESWVQGECTTDIPCEMDYSAFKPKQPCQTCGGSGEILDPDIMVSMGIKKKKMIPCPDCQPEKKGAKDGPETQLSHQS